MITRLQPDFYAMVGCCGGSPARTKRGDIIAITRSVPYHLGTQEPTHFRSDAAQSKTISARTEQQLAMIHYVPGWLPHLDEEIRDFVKKSPPDIHLGAVLCGDTVRSDITMEKWMEYEDHLATKKLYGVECESFPLFSSLSDLDRCICVKGVQDVAFEKSEDTKKFRKASIQLAAAYVATFIQEVFRKD